MEDKVWKKIDLKKKPKSHSYNPTYPKCHTYRYPEDEFLS